jgi:hypothetical protein
LQQSFFSYRSVSSPRKPPKPGSGRISEGEEGFNADDSDADQGSGSGGGGDLMPIINSSTSLLQDEPKDEWISQILMAKSAKPSQKLHPHVFAFVILVGHEYL